jgi:TRAP-type C4-dicarboxylate transport system substrate-binding protein
MTTKRTFVAASLCLAAGTLFAPAVHAQQPVELTFSVWIPHSHVLVANFMMPWAKEVEQATENRVKINFVPKPVANPVGHLDAVRNGVADLAFISYSYYPGRFDLMRFGMLPFSANSAESTSVAAWRIYDKYLRKAEEHRGVRLLGIYGHGPGGVYTTGKKVDKVEDFEGLKLRVGGGIQADLARVLKFNAVVKPAPESYELMSTGVVDGVLFPPESVASFRLDGIVKAATVFPGGLYSDLHGIIMNERAFAKLSPKDQQAVMKLSGEHIARMGGKAWGDADKAALESLRAKKVEFHQASPALVDGIRARTAEFEKEWLAAAKAKNLDGAKILADYRAEAKAIEGGK